MIFSDSFEAKLESFPIFVPEFPPKVSIVASTVVVSGGLTSPSWAIAALRIFSIKQVKPCGQSIGTGLFADWELNTLVCWLTAWVCSPATLNSWRPYWVSRRAGLHSSIGWTSCVLFRLSLRSILAPLPFEGLAWEALLLLRAWPYCESLGYIDGVGRM